VQGQGIRTLLPACRRTVRTETYFGYWKLVQSSHGQTCTTTGRAAIAVSVVKTGGKSDAESLAGKKILSSV
jgi:hypothetical protein